MLGIFNIFSIVRIFSILRVVMRRYGVRRIIALISSICLLFSASAAYGALNLELTQGNNAALPVAVLPFVGQSSLLSDAQQNPNNIAMVVTNDLQNSGQFDVMPWTKVGARQLEATSFDASYWRAKGIDNVITGKVTSSNNSSDSGYSLEFQLLSSYGSSVTSSSAGALANKKQVLLSKSFQVKSDQLRSGAHHVSDLVYKALLGKRGVFSTRIAYVNWYISKSFNATEKRMLPKYSWSLQIADADGYNAQTILRSPWPIMSPVWSPDGKNIAYVSFENNQSQVYLQNIITGKRQLLSQASGVNGAPAFSADGKRLAIVLSISGRSKIYLMQLPNGKPVAMLPAEDSTATIDTEPTWSPDGKNIVFTSDRGGSPQLYKYSLLDSSAKPQRLTFNGNYNARAQYLPDGKSLVIMHRSRGSSIFNIAKLNLDNGKMTFLTSDISSQSPSVAPNGDMVLYSTVYGGQQVLSEVSINGEIKIRLPIKSSDAEQGTKVEVKDPAWSPFLS